MSWQDDPLWNTAEEQKAAMVDPKIATQAAFLGLQEAKEVLEKIPALAHRAACQMIPEHWRRPEPVQARRLRCRRFCRFDQPQWTGTGRHGRRPQDRPRL